MCCAVIVPTLTPTPSGEWNVLLIHCSRVVCKRDIMACAHVPFARPACAHAWGANPSTRLEALTLRCSLAAPAPKLNSIPGNSRG
eukprot:6208377-Pleurochrysis_carterae.AAC.1